MARLLVVFAVNLCVLLSTLERTLCYNYETRLPVIKEGPENSYFGFSVAEHVLSTAIPSEPFLESVILVGAPIYQTNIDAVSPGGVFRCPFSSNYLDCSLLELDNNSAIEESGTVAFKDNQWLGVSVVSQGAGGDVAACAHRYKVRVTSINEIQGLGKCYFLNSQLVKNVINKDGYAPCLRRPRPINYNGNSYKYCQAGTDVAVSRTYMYGSEPSYSEYIMGIPGADNWLGGIATSYTPSERRPRILITPLAASENGVSFNSYLGFSVASAKLTDDSGDTVQMYVAGAPRSEAKGAVLILKSDRENPAPEDIFRIDAEKPSSSFGYDVTAADLTGDGYDELIVGAPQFFDRSAKAGGRVYIYHNVAHDGTFDVEPIKLTGMIDSLFGQVVANIKDINLDGCEDIAIGAPYENNGEGAVYIYLGNWETVIVQPASQKIRPSDLPMGLNSYPFPNASFGYSISGGIDLDGNGFPELAIGAYEKEIISVLRSRPVINVEVVELILSKETLDPNKTDCTYSEKDSICFTMEVCLSYTCPSDTFNDPITIKYDIEAEETRRKIALNSRVVFEASGTYNMREQTLVLPAQFAEEPIACTPAFNIVIRPPIQDIFRPIPLKMTYYIPEVEAIMPEPGDPLPSMSLFPILDNKEPVINAEVIFIKECAKDDDVCITDLVVEASVQLTGEPPVLKVGVQKELELAVSIANKGEDAYDARLVITFPQSLRYTQMVQASSSAITAGCHKQQDEQGANISSIICQLGNPYPMNAKDSFVVRYVTQDIPPDAEEFNITLVASSTNDAESNPADNEQVIVIAVESITDIVISGEGEEQMYFSGSVRGESAMEYFDDIGLEVSQNCTVYNEGPGDVHTAIVTIEFPVEVANGKWLLYLTEMPYVQNDNGFCNVTPSSYVNELKLKPRNQDLTYNPSPPVKRDTESRKKRAAASEAAKSTQELSAGKEITLDCKDGSAKCVTIRCELDPLTKHMNQVKIVTKSRLWNSTFLEDYINAKSVRVITEGYVEIESAPYITQKRTDNDRFMISIKVTADIKTLPPSKPLPWWVIALAVIGGLILLILIILLLWKCGFFERKTGYKYATVTQQQASSKGKMDKTGYYDDMYYS